MVDSGQLEWLLQGKEKIILEDSEVVIDDDNNGRQHTFNSLIINTTIYSAHNMAKVTSRAAKQFPLIESCLNETPLLILYCFCLIHKSSRILMVDGQLNMRLCHMSFLSQGMRKV